MIVWFRQDLRLTDTPALAAAADMGGASRWWLHWSLSALDADLDNGLLCVKGNASTVLPKVARNVKAEAVFWNRCYEPWRIDRDKRVKTALSNTGLKVRSFNGSLLFEAPTVSKSDGTPYKVFTPDDRRGCLVGAAPRTRARRRWGKCLRGYCI